MLHNFLLIIHLISQIIMKVIQFFYIICFKVDLICDMIFCLSRVLNCIDLYFFDIIELVLLAFGLKMRRGSLDVDFYGFCHIFSSPIYINTL